MDCWGFMNIALDVTGWVFTAVAFFLALVSVWKGYKTTALFSIGAAFALSAVLIHFKRAEHLDQERIQFAREARILEDSARLQQTLEEIKDSLIESNRRATLTPDIGPKLGLLQEQLQTLNAEAVDLRRQDIVAKVTALSKEASEVYDLSQRPQNRIEPRQIKPIVDSVPPGQQARSVPSYTPGRDVPITTQAVAADLKVGSSQLPSASVAAVLVPSVATFSTSVAQGEPPEMNETSSLQVAINRGEVIARFQGTGGSSGDSVIVEISKGPKAGGPQAFSVVAGSKLASIDPAAQDMIISQVAGRSAGSGSQMYIPVRDMQVPTSGTATYVLTAYCANFHKENPSTNTIFTLQSSNPTARCLVEQSLRRKVSIEATQAAIWMYTDRLTFMQVNDKFDVSRTDWDTASAVVAACGVPPK